MAYRVLEVTLISAKDLKKVTVFSKMRVYAVVSISGGDPRTPTHRTHSDRHGGRNPMWHAPLRFPIPTAADPRGLALHVLLRAERSFGDRDVGEVLVPVQDLASAAPPAGEHRHLSYQVRSPMSGRKRGVLHISYSLSDAPAPTAAGPGDPQYMQTNAAAKGGADPVTAYPPYHHQQQHAVPPYGYNPPYGYAGASYGYGPAAAAPYGYGASSAAAARQDGGVGMGSGFGMGLLGAAVGGMMIGLGEGVGEIIADSEMGMDGCF
ncbi:protein SRC2-like [Hordeum vulgare]|uniref:C2 domain-containing protein n=1 Tax=Hordeum vulgare subsp. vulgare TaxID=112509 RepID=A0A8I6WQI7_HORVV|nr:protein SRC2-like [Hordeum vulgare subsp. vulgare]KAE8800398.1 protein SRC2-like [Hordeum vulgare]